MDRFELNEVHTYSDLPSTDEYNDLATIELGSLVSLQPEEAIVELTTDLYGTEEIIDNSFSDIQVKVKCDYETHRDPLVISDNEDRPDENETHSCISLKSESENKFSSEIPTTVETVDKSDKSSRKAKVSRTEPRSHSVQSKYTFKYITKRKEETEKLNMIATQQ